MIRKCLCGNYTLKEICKCGKKTEPVHYKFIKIKDAPKDFRRV